jgi:hypothetical protein
MLGGVRTLVIDGPVVVVKRALVHLDAARVVHSLEGKVWVQSPDLDRGDLDELLELARAQGLTVDVLENQDPFPEGTDAE